MKAVNLSRQSLISLSILLGLLLLLLLVALAPLRNQMERYEFELLRDGRMLQQFKGVAAIQPGIDAAGQEFSERGLEQWVYTERSPSDVELDIQRRITEVLNEQQAEMGSIAPQPARTRGEHLNVGVRVRFSGSMPAVLATFTALEQSQPLLMLENVSLTPQRVRARRGEVPAQRVDVDLTVSTLMAAPPAAEPAEGGA
ncbi:type II secretion system protein GspM [Halopseudomonas salegens]|uniref:Type II secretion system (T2SS), protein M subtype b n=1 Tax=Halopseudomonas salegens TaxID=1434072 RepID=A0A1H2HWL9_9GAMM|nr:type II secretion system protein GspM [Halopseudomonas salegens]SDU36174.1 Type II secretion system (T2SS), protein M subtype b [Halopseudomonas salegens]